MVDDLDKLAEGEMPEAQRTTLRQVIHGYRLRADRIATLERANADLQSRLDELRRLHVPRTPLASLPPSRNMGPSIFWGADTASDRLREHMGDRSDPAGGG